MFESPLCPSPFGRLALLAVLFPLPAIAGRGCRASSAARCETGEGALEPLARSAIVCRRSDGCEKAKSQTSRARRHAEGRDPASRQARQALARSRRGGNHEQGVSSEADRSVRSRLSGNKRRGKLVCLLVREDNMQKCFTILIAVAVTSSILLAAFSADAATKKKKRHYRSQHYSQTYRDRRGLTPSQYNLCRQDQARYPTLDIRCD